MDRAVLDSFRTAIAGPPESVNVLGGAIAIASLSGTPPDGESVGAQLDLIARAVETRCDDPSDPVDVAHAIDFHLFTVLGFRGATADYGDPENSYIDRVLVRRVGIPITLSLVYLEVARRVGLACGGVGFPGHFLVRVGRDDESFFVDPFHQGSRLDAAELRARLRVVDLGGAHTDVFLQPVTGRQILQRMLNNLRNSFRERRDIERWRDTLELALCIEPWNSALVGERGMLNYRLGNLPEALDDLERYVGAADRGTAALGALRLLGKLRIRLEHGGAE